MSSSAKQNRLLLLYYAYQNHFQKKALVNFNEFFQYFAQKTYSEDFLKEFILVYEEKKNSLNEILKTENLDKFNLIDELLIKLMLCERLYFYTKSQNLLHYLNLSREYSTKDAYKVIHILMDKFIKLKTS